MSDRILVVEDDPNLVSVLTCSLTAEGFEVEDTPDGSDAIARVTREAFDLVLLDVILPVRNGLEICRELRARGNRTPIVMLTGRCGVEDKVAGLGMGADDYVVKPFEISELIARIRALLRRWRDQRLALSDYRFGDIQVNFVNGSVTRNGASVGLSTKELHLLRYLIARRGAVVSRQELLHNVWGYRGAVTRTLDMHIAALRQKLEDVPHEPRFILTMRGQGYSFRD
jgi:DNA-binding response OmpR family regulator